MHLETSKMKIKRIEIYGFGKWNHVTFDLTQGLQVFYGLNEAGKSTLRQFIYSVLFGFATGKGSNKYLRYLPKKGKSSAAYGGALDIEHQGHLYNVERTKGKNGGTLWIKNLETQTPMPPEFINEILGPVNQETYERLLGFNQSDLDDFDDLSNRDDLRRYILRMGAVGSEEWIKLENDLKKEAKAMYTSSSRTRMLDKKIKEYQKAEKQLQIDKDQFPDYQNIKAIQTEGEQQLKATRQEISKLSKQLSDTNALVDSWPNYVEMKRLITELKEIPQTYLKLDLNQLEVLLNQIQTAKSDIKNINQDIAKLNHDFNNQIDPKELTDLQSRLPEVKLNYGQVEDLNKRIARLVDQSKTIEEQYQNDISKLSPMPNDDFMKFKDLALNEKRTNADINQIKNQMLETSTSRTHSSTPNANIVLGLAAVLAIVDFLLPLSMIFKVIILAVILVAGYLTIKPGVTGDEPVESLNDVLAKNEATLQHIQQGIADIGQQTGFEIIPTDEWNALQIDLENYAHQSKEVAELKESLKKSVAQIENFWQFSDQVLTEKQTHDRSTINKISAQVTQLLQEAQQQQSDAQQRQILSKNLQNRVEELDDLELKLKSYDLPKENQDLNAWLEDLREKQALKLRLDALQKYLPAETIQKLDQYSDQNALLEVQNIETAKLNQAQKAEAEVLDERSDQIGQLTGLKNSVDILREQQELSGMQTELKDMISKWLTLQLGAKWVDQALGIATKGRLPIIMEQANQYFAQITNHRYQKIEFDTDDMVKVTDDNGEVFEIAELSKGTMEQLYISIRFAFMKSFSDTVQLPIIIDDAFVAFDDQRIKQIFTLLEKIAEQNQIIYFTAKKEVYQLTDSKNIINLNEN